MTSIGQSTCGKVVFSTETVFEAIMASASSQESTAHTSSNRSGFSHWAGRPLVNYKEGFFEAQEECKAGMKVTHLGGKRLEEDKSFQDLFRSWLWQVPFLSLQVRSVAERHIEFVLRGQRSTDENFLPSHWLDFDSKSYAAPLDLDELLKSLEPHVSLEKAKNMAVSLKHLLQMIRGKVEDLRKAGRMEELRLGVLATLKFTGGHEVLKDVNI